MPNYLVVLHLSPAAAIDPATFTSYLLGLTIKGYYILYDTPSGYVATTTL